MSNIFIEEGREPMDLEQVIVKLQDKNLVDILELIEDAKTGELEELELVESIGLVHDDELNQATLNHLRGLGVNIIFVTDDE